MFFNVIQHSTEMLLFVYICFLLLIASTNTSPTKNAPKAKPEYRLPQDVVKPNLYDLELSLATDVFTTNTFSGILNLELQILKETQEIKIHANDHIEFSEIKLSEANGNVITLENNGNLKPDPVTEILTIKSNNNLSSGSYKLTFRYNATLRTDEMYGFYKSSYTKQDGTPGDLATTQFQSTYARRAFPCFDEPIFKAEFQIKIRYPKQYNALGNTLGTTAPDPENSDYKITNFAKTPVMSTYLIAFVVSEFTCAKALPSDVPHQICSRVGAASSRKYALNVGPKILTALEQFTGIKYTESGLPKIDQVAIPDFAAGAMENWGLATYRETALLWDEQHSSNRYKQRVATVIAHELAHMWFGDLVTTHWWSDTFLNEGFATFFEYLITAEVETSWEVDKQFVLEELQPMLVIDALKTSKQLSLSVSSPDEVSDRFSSVSYNKGGSIFRMVQHFLGKDNFKEKINKYLTKHKFGNTKPEDLWKSLGEDATNLPQSLQELMNNWVVNPGYPVLEVTISNGTDVAITQERFFTDGGIPQNEEQWYVPITFTKSSDSNKFQDTSTTKWLLPNESAIISNALENNNAWIILNNQQIGYYRINYDDTLWERISNALNNVAFEGIHVLNRAQLVDDCFNFAIAGLRSYTQCLNFLTFLKKDVSYYPWYAAFTAFSGMLQRTENEEIRTKLSEYILELMESLYNNHPFYDPKDDNQIYTHTRVLALNWACRLGLEDCKKNSITAFNDYKKSDAKTKPDKNLRSIIYCNALRYSENINEDWDFLWREFLSSEISTEQVTILTALGCAQDETILTDYLKKSINATSRIRQQDALSVFSAVYTGNPGGVNLAFDFLLNNYETISSYYGSMNSLSSLINGLASRFTNEEQTNKLKTFIENTPDLKDSLKTSATSALNNALANLNVTHALEKELSTYFMLDTTTTAPTTKDGTSLASSEMNLITGIATLMMLFQRLAY